MALHYSTPAKAKAHHFMLKELDRHSIVPDRVLTLPSVDAHCALALRQHFGETITEQRTQEWTEPSPVVADPKITIVGIERQRMIVLRSTLIERGVLQAFWATSLLELTRPYGQIEVGETNLGRKRLTMVRMDPEKVDKFDFLNLDLTCAYGPNLAETIRKAVHRFLAPGGLVTVTTLQHRDAYYGAGEHAHYHYQNAKSTLTLTSWRPE